MHRGRAGTVGATGAPANAVASNTAVSATTESAATVHAIAAGRKLALAALAPVHAAAVSWGAGRRTAVRPNPAMSTSATRPVLLAVRQHVR